MQRIRIYETLRIDVSNPENPLKEWYLYSVLGDEREMYLKNVTDP